MPVLRTYHLFISHAWSYGEDYRNLVELLESAPNFSFKNYSVPEHDPLIEPGTSVGKKKLQGLIDGQIRPASIVLVIAGMYVQYKDWIQYEIDSALSMGKPILGINPRGQIRSPSEVTSVADEMVNWNTASIVDAIRRKSSPRT
jgi:hypothetical protein